MPTILIAEDDKNIQLLIRERLKHHYTILCANDGKEALDLLDSTHVDLLIADVMMPRLDGFQLVKTLREENNMVPVLMLTAKQSFDDKKQGFSSGVDDYMTKPVNYEELLWRIQALMRRAKIATDKRIEIGDVILDSSNYTLTRNNEVTELPKKEFELLYKFLSYPGTIFTRNQLLDEIWGFDSVSGEDTIKTHINRLRNKFKDYKEFEIITIKGLGYKANINGGKNHD